MKPGKILRWMFFLAIFGVDPEVKLKASRMCAQSSNP